MNYPLLTFVAIALAVGGLLWFLLKGTLLSISGEAASHARIYAVAYVKGGSLISIAAFAAFEQAYWALDEVLRNSMPWAPYVILFSKPITGGLAVLVAFLDRSSQRATEEATRIKTGDTAAPWGKNSPPPQSPPPVSL